MWHPNLLHCAESRHRIDLQNCWQAYCTYKALSFSISYQVLDLMFWIRFQMFCMVNKAISDGGIATDFTELCTGWRSRVQPMWHCDIFEEKYKQANESFAKCEVFGRWMSITEAEMDSSYSLATEFHMRGGRGSSIQIQETQGINTIRGTSQEQKTNSYKLRWPNLTQETHC